MKYDLLVRSALFEGKPCSVAVLEERIVALGEVENEATKILDAEGLSLLPGVIDSHVHFNEPGRTEWEGFASGSAALAAGGGTLFFDMPLNSSPATNSPEAFRLKLAAAQASSLTDFALWGGVTPDNFEHLEALAECGVVGFKAFYSPSGIEEFGHVSESDLERAMEIIAPTGLLLAVHAEDPMLLRPGTGATPWRRFADSRPMTAEISAVRTVIDLAAVSGCRAHIVHVSCPEVLQMIGAARANGVDITGEICAHHLLLDETAMETLGSLAKCAPPLRPRDTVERLWGALPLATTLGSDHSPAPPEMKAGQPFERAWGGISGVQHTLPLLLDQATERGVDLREIIGRLSSRVAERFRLPKMKGRLEVGSDADFCLVGFSREAPIQRDSLLDRHRQSPYVGRMMRACVTHTIRRGEVIFENGRTTRQGGGRLVRPEPL